LRDVHDREAVKDVNTIDLGVRSTEKYPEENPGKAGARGRQRRRIKEEIRKEV
jgi:hypothetical protein